VENSVLVEMSVNLTLTVVPPYYGAGSIVVAGVGPSEKRIQYLWVFVV
jgi:hypothetical protein